MDDLPSTNDRTAARHRLRALREERRTVQREIAAVEHYLAVLEPLLILEGITPASDHPTWTLPVAGGAQPGNRIGSHTPPRRVPYHALSLMTALRHLLAAHGTASVRQLAEWIFDISDHDDYDRAATAVTKVLSRGLARGHWERTGPGVYHLTPPAAPVETPSA